MFFVDNKIANLWESIISRNTNYY